MDGGINKSRSKPRNILRGLTPVATGFDTPPSDLPNSTDGNPNNPSGVGTTVKSAGAETGYIAFDLGSIKTVLVGCRIGMWATASVNNALYIDSKESVTYYNQPASAITTISTSNTNIREATPVLVTGRYIRFRFWGSATSETTFSIQPYEFYAYELGF
jgi:hypothetical protein